MGAEGESGFTFKASRGWFENLSTKVESILFAWHGETACSNKETAEKYVGEFRHFVNAEGHLPQQVFNCDVTGVFI